MLLSYSVMGSYNRIVLLEQNASPSKFVLSGCKRKYPENGEAYVGS